MENPKLPSDAKERKAVPIATGVLDYFPLALTEVARVSRIGNDQHNPGQPLHWDKSKSTDHADCLLRHLIDRGKTDNDGVSHTAKVAWRALALLEMELEKKKAAPTNEDGWTIGENLNEGGKLLSAKADPRESMRDTYKPSNYSIAKRLLGYMDY